MEQRGEYSVAAIFPALQSAFSLTFYGAQGKGNAYVQIFKADGTPISSVTIYNVTNGPYFFTSTTQDIKGFSLYNDDVGGLAIYEIGYGNNPSAAQYFLDTFTD
jgi:hypothetical protein